MRVIFSEVGGDGVNDQNATATTSINDTKPYSGALFNLKNYFLNLDSNTGGSVLGGGNYSWRSGDHHSIT